MVNRYRSLVDVPVCDLPMSLQNRFWAKVDVRDDLDTCWLWTAAVSRPSIRDLDNRARPRFRLQTFPVRVVYAHRFSLALKLGCSLRDLDGYEACHKPGCTSVLCVNPNHLYRGTQSENRDDRYPWRRLTPKMELA